MDILGTNGVLSLRSGVKQRKKKALAELGLPFRASRLLKGTRGKRRVTLVKNLRSSQSSISSGNFRIGNSRFWAQIEKEDPLFEARETLRVAEALQLRSGSNDDHLVISFAEAEKLDRARFWKSQKVPVCK